jgi:hypothetical protein
MILIYNYPPKRRRRRKTLDSNSEKRPKKRGGYRRSSEMKAHLTCWNWEIGAVIYLLQYPHSESLRRKFANPTMPHYCIRVKVIDLQGG